MKCNLNTSRNDNKTLAINSFKARLAKFIKKDTVLFIALLLGFFSSFNYAFIWIYKLLNIGGMGTLIASMASVISYKIYVKEYPSENKNYMKVFSVYNVIGLIIFISFTLLLI